MHYCDGNMDYTETCCVYVVSVDAVSDYDKIRSTREHIGLSVEPLRNKAHNNVHNVCTYVVCTPIRCNTKCGVHCGECNECATVQYTASSSLKGA